MFQRPPTLMLLQNCKSIAIQMGGVPRYKLAVFLLLSAKRQACFCKSIAIEMGGVPRYFSKDGAFFAYSWKLPAYSGALLLTVDNFSFFTYSWSFFAYSFSFFTYSWSFLAYSGKVRLIRALRDCKQRSLTVSKKAPTVSKKASP